MSGYAATARVERRDVRLGETVVRTFGAPRTPASPPPADAATIASGERRTTVGERWDDLVRAWQQTTFYLFDSQSWR